MITDFTLRGVILLDFDIRRSEPCDLIFRNGRLAHMRPLAGEGESRLFLTPGFWDAHHHLLHHGLSARRCDLSACASLEEALDRLSAYVRAQTTGECVVWAERWDESGWTEPRTPTRADIDRVVADRPVVMRRICGHCAVLNSRAIEDARRHWGTFDDSGSATEEQALGLSTVWPPSAQEREDALLRAQDAAIAMGITRVNEMGGPSAAETYTTIEQRGRLKIDVRLFLPPDQMERAVELRRQGTFDGPRLRLGGIKLYTDGSVGARTAALREPYVDRTTAGELRFGDADLLAVMRRCRQADLRIAIHAIGDAAIDQVLRLLEQLAGEEGALPPGWVTLEHAELVDEAMLDRAQVLRVGLSLQPNFVARWGGEGGLYEHALGRERARRANPYRDVWDRRIPMFFGSDGMPMDPALGLKGAVGHPRAEQRLTAEEALSVYVGGRAAPEGLWEEEAWWQLGSAGAVLYDRDPLELADGDLSRAPVLGVLWRGQWILEPPADLFRSGVIHVS